MRLFKGKGKIQGARNDLQRCELYYIKQEAKEKLKETIT